MDDREGFAPGYPAAVSSPWLASAFCDLWLEAAFLLSAAWR